MIEKSVVKILTKVVVPSYSAPWSARGSGTATGTGFAMNISKNSKKLRILTNAHVVDEAIQIYIIKQGSSYKYKAKIDFIVYECDLAWLELDLAGSDKKKEKKFWDDTPPIPLGTVPAKMTKIRCYGYPLGGMNLSVTRGVISRVENATYMDIADGIAIQIDASINPGNSGGPAIGPDDTLAGVVFLKHVARDVEGVGFIIPTLYIRYCLRYFKRHRSFKGISYLGVNAQSLENENLRKFAQLSPAQTGVYVNYVEEGSPSDGKVKEGDVLSKINGKDIDYDGAMRLSDVVLDFDGPAERPSNDSILMSKGEIISYHDLIGLKVPGDVIELSLVRNGKEKKVKITLAPRLFLIPINNYQMPKPQYYIIAGLMFVPLSRMFLMEKMQAREDVGGLLSLYSAGKDRENDEQVLVLARILSSGITHGYEDNTNSILGMVNGKEVRNIQDLHKIVTQELSKSSHLVFVYEDTPEVHVFESKSVKKFNMEIIKENIGDIPPYSF